LPRVSTAPASRKPIGSSQQTEIARFVDVPPVTAGSKPLISLQDGRRFGKPTLLTGHWSAASRGPILPDETHAA
jgi:hypothetical protein